MSDPLQPAPRPSRGIYLLPNLFTTAGMMAGFFAIIAAFNGLRSPRLHRGLRGRVAGWPVDGRIARMTNTQSDFGVQYDSLADLVSFGVAPAW
jgi:CDP-diacylglycerol--serine O-phosphatidyltransferase